MSSFWNKSMIFALGKAYAVIAIAAGEFCQVSGLFLYKTILWILRCGFQIKRSQPVSSE
ncbi:hypothetical protein VCRA2119O44_120088 [Vibrio crassostreae]|nr:hypothetical protein VCRA2116O27_100125 [Vibrio crassostreae]CAK1722485.1 hypothetical protein VCRA2117O38_110122 [Vibrio crassostreae]CAK1722749.1 hypothetical protein VCRA2116O26_110122 [Vibrio crassostreae]CAK1737202.1 hypothetical protein VCRA2119O44_120088 [Vibrio crassostreae]CAK1741452.1 hypothetical protein VCRA2113O22_120122 [Vibrio crassostreae]